MTTEPEKLAFKWAAANQGFVGSYDDWLALPSAERAEYEIGAGGEAASAVNVCGTEIQHDKSGVGHCWVPADEYNCPASIAEEISAEIIDGGIETTDDFVASNGQHYRWS